MEHQQTSHGHQIGKVCNIRIIDRDNGEMSTIMNWLACIRYHWNDNNEAYWHELWVSGCYDISFQQKFTAHSLGLYHVSCHVTCIYFLLVLYHAPCTYLHWSRSQTLSTGIFMTLVFSSLFTASELVPCAMSHDLYILFAGLIPCSMYTPALVLLTDTSHIYSL